MLLRYAPFDSKKINSCPHHTGQKKMQADSKANPFCKGDALISSQYLGQFFPNPPMRWWEAVNYPRGTRSRVAECGSFRHTDKHVRPSLYSSSGFVTAPQSALGTGTGSICRKLGFSDPTRCFGKHVHSNILALAIVHVKRYCGIWVI